MICSAKDNGRYMPQNIECFEVNLCFLFSKKKINIAVLVILTLEIVREQD